MSEPGPDPLDARALAEQNPWFSWLGLAVGAALVVGGVVMAADAARDLASMPDRPTPCAAAECPDDQWVVVTDATWRPESAVHVDGPYVYVPLVPRGASPLLLAAVEDSRERGVEGVISPVGARSPLAEVVDDSTRILWVGHGPGNSGGLIAIGVVFVLVGLLCLAFYGRVLLRSRRVRAGAASGGD